MTEKPIPLLVEVARLYYEQNYSQQQIAERLGLSRPGVSRLLKQAREQDIIKIEIHDPMHNRVKLEAGLRDEFHLEKVMVVSSKGNDAESIKTELGKTAADYLDTLVTDGLTLGISWGTTVREIARHLHPRPVHNMTVVQMLGGISKSKRDTHASESALKIGENYQAVPYLLPLPAIVDNAELKNTIVSDKNIARVLELAQQSEIALFSVGVFNHDSVLVQAEYFLRKEVEALLAQGAVCDICSRLITADGKICSAELDDRTIGIGLNDLKQKKLAIAVAGGREKLLPIRAGLRGGYFNVLITDEWVAGALLYT